MLLVLLAQLLLLFLLCKMMADGAARCRAQYGVASGNVPSDGPDGGALEATFGFRAARCSQENATREVHCQYSRGNPLPVHLIALPA